MEKATAMEKLILKKLAKIEMLLMAKKDILTVNDLMIYTGWSKSYIYKLTSNNDIPHSKLRKGGKLIFFKRKKIDKYLTAYTVKTNDEIGKIADDFLTKKNKKGNK
jgi:excisionase family DNA binding protein